ncbi:sugar phosphate isomerase/epimerase family protein [Faecalibaculum rodentium]|uniref:sugar phosphate isomerase/epimerase family protein n=2 Tax=Faecalibaculum rodentium TaxID=1702221 RepID=UPI0025A55185|nr:sugar phosphate isomerase/epimerase [Faecalibaculum rodentium]
MKLGLLTSILDGWSFKEAVDIASDMGFECLEAACWPQGKATRRYAGVSHIDVQNLTQEKADEITEYCRKKNIGISALAYYPNPMDADETKRKANIGHLLKVIDASHLLGVNLVTTFIGRDQNKTVEENLELVKEIWPGIINHAENLGVKIAIENCPMLFGPDEWPGGQNIMTAPDIWEKVFEILPGETLGLNYDPSHFVWRMMDYIEPLYTFRDKIFHVHFKDIKLYPEKLKRVGTMAYPTSYMSPKLPGLGDVDWGRYVSALTDIGYQGYSCIEVEDKAFENSRERILDSIRISKRYLSQFVI